VLIDVVVDDTANAIFQQRDVEVDDQADVKSRQPQIREDLCDVDRGDPGNALDFDDEDPARTRG
jgi:hypothetical protein